MVSGGFREPASAAPGLPCGSYERETTNLHSRSGTRTLFRWHGFLSIEHRCTGCTGLTGRELPAPEANSGDGPARICGLPALEASVPSQKFIYSVSDRSSHEFNELMS